MKLTDARTGAGPRRLFDRIRFERFRRRHQPLEMPSVGVASGKGGTGKTFVAVNLAVLLAREIGGVQMLDADLGLGNAHVHLGLRPMHNLQHYFDGDALLEDLLLGSCYGVRLLPGGSGISRLAQLDTGELRRLAHDMPSILTESNALIVDSGAGISPQTLLFLRCSDVVLLVVTPELTSLTDAYALIKCLVIRQPQSRFLVLVNRADEQDQGIEVFQRINDVASRFLSLPLHYLGAVPEDRAARASVAGKVPLVVRTPSSPAARALKSAASSLEDYLRDFRRQPRSSDFSQRLLQSL